MVDDGPDKTKDGSLASPQTPTKVPPIDNYCMALLINAACGSESQGDRCPPKNFECVLQCVDGFERGVCLVIMDNITDLSNAAMHRIFGEDTVKDIGRRALSEFIGTTILVTMVGLSSTVPPTLSWIVPGLTLSIVVFSLGHVSLASFNPAVSISMGIRRILSVRVGEDLFVLKRSESLFLSLTFRQATAFYILAQLTGGIIGSLLCHAFLLPGASAAIPDVGKGYSVVQAFFAEFIGTFMLCSSVLHCGCSSDTEGNSFFGLAIGSTLLLIALVFGNISGAVINPAVVTSSCVKYVVVVSLLSNSKYLQGLLGLFAKMSPGNSSIPQNTWIYFVGKLCCSVSPPIHLKTSFPAPPLAAILAALTFRLLSPKDHAPVKMLMKGPVDHRQGHTMGILNGEE
jgi:aquaporin Z